MPIGFRPTTVRQLIFWEYAKLVAASVTGGRRDYAFVRFTYDRLSAATIEMSSLLRENRMLVECPDACAYCGKHDVLEWDHIVPLAAGGPDTIDNLVRACGACNRAKGARDPYQWYGPARYDDIPRLVLGKLLKLVLNAYEHAGLADSDEYMRDAGIERSTLSSIFRR